ICFVPGLPTIGAILGVIALFVIGAAAGRLGGRGLAVAGVVVGLILTLIQVALIFGAMAVAGQFQALFVAPMARTMGAVEAGDVKAVQASFSADVASQITSAHLADFKAAYQADLGAYQGVPEGLIAYLKLMSGMQTQLQTLQGQPPSSSPPLIANFARGDGLVLLITAAPGTPGGPNVALPPLTNIVVIGPTGTQHWLIPPAAPATAPPAADPGATTADPADDRDPGGS
ncbi:MAG TPA: hypothetical protein VD963_04685, partial [Phycisphaerales bacterium]|nr:hypothetical protein [Phycisphaerales bacterium]